MSWRLQERGPRLRVPHGAGADQRRCPLRLGRNLHAGPGPDAETLQMRRQQGEAGDRQHVRSAAQAGPVR